MSVTKVTLRETCLKRLQTVGTHNKNYRDARLNKRLQRHPRIRRAQSVLGFWPLGMEPDIRTTLGTLRRGKKSLSSFYGRRQFQDGTIETPADSKAFWHF